MHSPDHYHGKASDHAESAVRHDDVKGINLKKFVSITSVQNVSCFCSNKLIVYYVNSFLGATDRTAVKFGWFEGMKY